MKYKKPKSRRKLFRMRWRYGNSDDTWLDDFLNFLGQPIRFRMTRCWFYEKRINWKKSRKNIMKPL